MTEFVTLVWGASTEDKNSANSVQTLPTVMMKVNISRRNDSALIVSLLEMSLNPQSLHDASVGMFGVWS